MAAAQRRWQNGGRGVRLGQPDRPAACGPRPQRRAIGDCLSRLFDATGWNVKREFYYNDAGVQIQNLAISVQARARGIAPGDAGWPEDGYRGDYIADVARPIWPANR
jgi:hypothetical protein